MRKMVKSLLRFLYSYEKYLALGADIVNICARIYIMRIFILSGWLKISNLPGAFFLFRDVYKIPLIDYRIMTTIAIFSELVLAPLLVLGLMTRYLAIYFLVMTLVINQIFMVQQHYYWMIILAVLSTYGGGKISVDAQLKPRLIKV